MTYRNLKDIATKSVMHPSEVLWSESFSTDAIHAVPAADHDPNATGWIALCNAFCTGRPQPDKPTNGLACTKCNARLT